MLPWLTPLLRAVFSSSQMACESDTQHPREQLEGMFTIKVPDGYFHYFSAGE
jgi:hypothetical protein